MAKMLAMLAAFSYCVYLGLSGAERLRKRENMLTIMGRFVRQVTVFLDYSRLPLTELIIRCSGDDALFIAIAEELRNGLTALEAYNCVSRQAYFTQGFRALNDTDRSILTRFFAVLGRTDALTQKEHALMAANELEQAAADAAAAYNARGKMLRTLGVLAGTAIAILMI